jgi:bifunctional N-acetylglucosamine-1-phosphate-uridyltransferase/glucosamine-1-phosphate-acetyltransferase GlmU-like protein
LMGKTAIGENCTIGPNSIVRDSTIGNHCRITASVAQDTTMEDGSSIGPFGHVVGSQGSNIPQRSTDKERLLGARPR